MDSSPHRKTKGETEIIREIQKDPWEKEKKKDFYFLVLYSIFQQNNNIAWLPISIFLCLLALFCKKEHKKMKRPENLRGEGSQI